MIGSSDVAAGLRSRRTMVIVGVVAGVLVVILAARGLRDLTAVHSFLRRYPGTSSTQHVPTGLPAWLDWQHGLNAFFLLFVLRSGWQVRANPRPRMFWTRGNSRLSKTWNPPKRISIDLWLHLTVDTLWVLNGLVFYVLLFSTGQWRRVVPTQWNIVPNALSTALQYASLDWPAEHGWTNYNALQTISYFAIIFLVAPLALLSGIRLSPSWPARAARLNKLYPVETARRLHYPTMLAFVGFIIVHVILVLITGPLRNVNHMYASRDDNSWIGMTVLLAATAAMVAAWFAIQPPVLRAVASLTGKVTR